MSGAGIADFYMCPVGYILGPGSIVIRNASHRNYEQCDHL